MNMSGLAQAEAAQIGQAQTARYGSVYMAERIRPRVSESCRVRRAAGADTVHDDDDNPFESHCAASSLSYKPGKYLRAF